MCCCSSFDGKRDIFEDSTHKFVLYNGVKKDLNGCIVGLFVIAVQFALYIVCANQVSQNLDGDTFLIPVQVRYGKNCNERDGNPANLVCNPQLPDIKYVALAAIMLSLFLMKDIIGPIRGFKKIPGIWSKIWCIILFIETLFASLVAIMFAVGATEPYDAIANCIGVLFIHDLDEKAYEAFKMLQGDKDKDEEDIETEDDNICCSCCSFLGRCAKTAFMFFAMFIILSISLSLAGYFRVLQETQIKEVYGDTYWQNNFANGYYDYEDLWDSVYYDWDGELDDDTFASFANDTRRLI